MFTLVFQKLWSKKWMIVSLLLGNLLMVSIASAGPLYSNAALQRALTRNLSTYYTETNNQETKNMNVMFFKYTEVTDGFEFESLLYLNAVIADCLAAN